MADGWILLSKRENGAEPEVRLEGAGQFQRGPVLEEAEGPAL